MCQVGNGPKDFLIIPIMLTAWEKKFLAKSAKKWFEYAMKCARNIGIEESDAADFVMSLPEPERETARVSEYVSRSKAVDALNEEITMPEDTPYVTAVNDGIRKAISKIESI